uniref:Uncharacterized protein n=1 Tax=Anguilla anguilla TaxID=7936 RepID=A0A0E9RSG0_ANGAN
MFVTHRTKLHLPPLRCLRDIIKTIQ